MARISNAFAHGSDGLGKREADEICVPEVSKLSTYLLYEYKRTNTDT